jgi:hypothetical protein
MKLLNTFSLAIVANAAIAQWNTSTQINTPVSTASNWQIDLRMVEDGQKGTFIVWKDYRNGTPDIYAQHIDSTGTALWNINGAPVCTQSADQSTPSILPDGQGGVIISWSDWRSGIERDIYAQRLNQLGQPVWQPDGVVVVNKVNREHNERMVSDGQGGAIVVFEQKNSSTYLWEIWAQRINASGNVVWANGGVPVSGFISEHLNERVQSDGQGGVYVTFQDFRNGFDFDVYVQHLDGNGNRLWNTGVLACNAFGTQTNPKIDPDYLTGGVIVSWTDKRNGIDYDIYAQRIDFNGNLLWGDAGKPICVQSGNQSAIEIYSNALVEGVIFAWKDNRSGSYDIYANRVDMNGNSLWQNNGMIICGDTGDQLNPNVTGDGFGGVAIVWQDASLGGFDVKAQRIYKEGFIYYQMNGVVISDATNIQTSPKSVSDGFGNGIFAWEDSRSGSPDIYCAKLNWGGPYVGIETNTVPVWKVFPNPSRNNVQVTSDSKIESIQLFDAAGAEVFSSLCAESHLYSINVEHLKSGVYFIKIFSKGNCSIQKLIKE